jgi:ubiquinone/menaquinone biosynthesis C-methylase UbiE
MRLFFWRKSSDSTPDELPRWRWLGGRRMLNAPYLMPKDKLEGDRLNLQHHLLKVAAGGNYRAPLRQAPRAILDVACGTGIWARELAVQYPRARVVGFDYDRTPLERALEVLGPGGQFPANFRFVEANMFERFPFEDGEFDYTFSRFLVVATPTDNWPHIAREMLRVTKRGGYVEMVDMQQFPVTQSPAYNRVLEAAADLVHKRGMQTGVEHSLKGYLEAAGLQQVQERAFRVGTGRQGNRQQRLLISDLLAGHRNLKGALVKLGYFSEPEFDELMAGEERELPQYGVYLPVIYTFGVKL